MAAEQGGAHWRALAQRACVGYGAAKKTVENMVLAGELEPVDRVRVPGARRPMVRYAPASNWTTTTTGSLDAVTRTWVR